MKDAQGLIRKILLTEKGTRLSEAENKYQFHVATDANKLEVKRAVEQLFGVHVTGVNTMVRKGKKKRERTQHFGRTNAWKRALVTLKTGETIDLT